VLQGYFTPNMMELYVTKVLFRNLKLGGVGYRLFGGGL